MLSELSPDFFRILAALAKLVVLSMLLERGLILIFDYRWYKAKLDGYGLKVPISLLFSWIICGYYKFDVLSILFEPDKSTGMGMFLTAAIAAGGSAGAIMLFQRVFNFGKEARTGLEEARKAEVEARKMRAEAEKAESARNIRRAQEP